MPSNWKTPYIIDVQKKDDDQYYYNPHVTPRRPTQEELQALTDKFQTGIKEISNSVQQFEKTIASMVNLFQSWEKNSNPPSSSNLAAKSSSSSAHGQNPELINPLQSLNQVFSLLGKVDFNQINQLINSPLFTNLMAQNDYKKGKS